MFVAGIPHGAIEYHWHQDERRRKARGPGPRFALVYLVVGMVCTALYSIAPVPGVIAFLVASMMHFGLESPDLKTSGLFVVAAPFLVHPDATLMLFDQLSGSAAFSTIDHNGARIFGLLGFMALGMEAVARGQRGPRVAFLVVTFLLLPPVQAVALYFLCLHSADALEEQWAMRARYWDAAACHAQTAIAALAVAGAVGLLGLTASGWLTVQTAAALAIGFTTPHLFNASVNHNKLRAARPRRS